MFNFLRELPVNLLRYLPRYLARDTTFKDVEDTLSREHESYRLRVMDLARQFFIDFADWSMCDWEDFTGVLCSNDDLELRRARVKAKLLGAQVMTLANTNALIRSFTGEEFAHVEEHAPNQLRVVLPEFVPYWRDLVNALLELMPAHLALEYMQPITIPSRVHVGQAEAWQGLVSIDPQPPNDKFIIKNSAAQALGVTGDFMFDLAKPAILRANEHKVQAAQALIFGGEILIDADERDFVARRIFESAIADILTADVGIARRGIMRPTVRTHDEKFKLNHFVGNSILFDGALTIKPATIAPMRRKIYSANFLRADGEVAIGTDARIKTAEKSRQQAGSAVAIGGEILIGSETLPREMPEMVLNRAFISRPKTGVAEIFEADVTIEPCRPTLASFAPLAGLPLVFGGEIIVGSETSPSIYPEPGYYKTDMAKPKMSVGLSYGGEISVQPSKLRGGKIATFSGTAIEIDGGVVVGLGKQLVTERFSPALYGGAPILVSGEIIIGPEKTSFPDIVEFLEGNWLRLYFDFPTGRDHPVLLQNPRGDLLVADIKEVGDFADDNNLFRNSRAEDTIGIHRAELIRGMNLNLAADDDILPAADSLRLFFDFPKGNRRRILLHNIRGGITARELRQMSNATADANILRNAYNQNTSGITRVAAIRNFKIRDGNGDIPVKFDERRLR